MLQSAIITILGAVAGLLAALARLERRKRHQVMCDAADAAVIAAEARDTAYTQGYAEGLTEGYRRGRHDLRSAVERARLHGYAEALADQELGESEGGE